MPTTVEEEPIPEAKETGKASAATGKKSEDSAPDIPSKARGKSAKSAKNDKGRKPQNHGKSKASSDFALLTSLIGTIEGEGVLDPLDSYGFLRSSDYNYLSSPDDIYISRQLIKMWNMKKGDTVRGEIRLPREGERFLCMQEVTSVNGLSLEELRQRKGFRHLVPLFPQEKLRIIADPQDYSTRITDLVAPLGKGQRAMIVAPPKAGKTIILRQIANGISQNHPEVYLIILMVGERPEEVTDMRRNVKAEVIASTFDETHDKHVKVASMTIEKAKRLVECGRDVVVILDSLTRLGRAYNMNTPNSGKTLSGGIDANALHTPKRFFGAARNIEGGGSLTIIASALIETGSRMDEVIFEEFKGTGNQELVLNRTIAEKGIYPAIDIQASSTRRAEELHSPEQFKFIRVLRSAIADMPTPEEALKSIIQQMKGTKSNEEFLASLDY